MTLIVMFIAVFIVCSALGNSTASLTHTAKVFHMLPENQFPKPMHHKLRFIATTVPHLSTHFLH